MALLVMAAFTAIVRHGNLVTKGLVYKIFSNPVYIGIAAYKGQHFPGEHVGIIGRALWDTVQTHLKNGTPMNKARLAGRGGVPSLLRGLLFSEQGRAFTPGWTRKKNKTYRYYINTDSIKIGKDTLDWPALLTRRRVVILSLFWR